MKIFLSIASYQDPILPYTIKSALENAKYKRDLVLGVFDQSLNHIEVPCNVRYKTCEPRYARGACWARSVIQKNLFNGEEIFVQVDSHTMFEKNWDANLLEKYINCLSWFDKPVITGYPPAFDVIAPKGGFFNTNEEYIFRGTTEDSDHTSVMLLHEPFKIGYHSSQRAHIIPGNKYFRGFGLAAGFIFTSGKFVEEVPYDDQIYFSGEETTLALRAFTNGWDIVHVPNIPLYHWYNTENAELKRELHWEGHNTEELREQKDSLIKRGQKKVDLVLQGKVSGIHGLGDKRTLSDFADFSGIDYENKMQNMDKCMFKAYENSGIEVKEC